MGVLNLLCWGRGWKAPDRRVSVRTLSYLLILLLLAQTLHFTLGADCSSAQFRCDCGQPKCIDKLLVRDGVKDCLDGSDEGQWDPSKCLIKNTTSEDIRFKRAVTRGLVSYPNYYALLLSRTFGTRTARATLRSHFPPRSGSVPNRAASRSSPAASADYEYEYVYEDDTPATPPPPPTPAPTRASPGARFRGRAQQSIINPTPASRNRTPFTLTPSSAQSSRTPSRSRGRAQQVVQPLTTTSRPFIPSRTRGSSRYQASQPQTTTSRTSRFRNRYNSRDSFSPTTPAPTSRSSRFGTRGRGSYSNASPIEQISLQPALSDGPITVTHYIPQETQIPFVNGKSTEYKVVLTPSPSLEILAPYQITPSVHLGKEVLVIATERTATPTPGVTEVTRFIIRESPTTAVAFTPTTIRGRRTSFSHIIPSTVYSVEPLVSTITAANPLQGLDQSNPLTNLLLSQLLNQGLLNPANLLGLQQPLVPSPDPATPITHYSTKTSTYVTTVTDFTSTIVKITLHGKPIKSTIVDSKTNIITATELITESTVIQPQPQPTLATQQVPNNAQQNLLLQNLLQLQQQQQLLPQILPTPSATLPTLSLPTQLLSNLQQQQKQKEDNKKEEKDINQEEESVHKPSTSKAPEPAPKKAEPASTVVTLYVSGKNPGEFSTVLQTVPVSASRRRREIPVTPTLLYPGLRVPDEEVVAPVEEVGGNEIVLEGSLSYSDPFVNLATLRDFGGTETLLGTEALETVLDPRRIVLASSLVA